MLVFSTLGNPSEDPGHKESAMMVGRLGEDSLDDRGDDHDHDGKMSEDDNNDRDRVVSATVGDDNRHDDDTGVDHPEHEENTDTLGSAGRLIDGDKKRKKYERSKNNRNIRRVLTTVKNKIETIQESYGGTANFILIMEDNFTDVSSHGRKTNTNRKMIVTAGGELKEAFINNTITYEAEKMFILKKGKTLERDMSFDDQFLAAKNVTRSPVAAMNNAVNPISSSVQSSPDSAANSLIHQLLKLTKNKIRSNKRRRTDSSTESDEYSDSSEENIRRNRKQKKDRGGD